MKTTQNINFLTVLNVKKSRYLANLIAIATLTLAGAAYRGNAQSIWNAIPGSSANTNWSSAENWSPNGVPDGHECIVR